MKLMRSTKEGTLCADFACLKPIKIGDPIAYFGPGFVYGLTCHENERTKKHLATLLASEAAITTKTELPPLSHSTDSINEPSAAPNPAWILSLVTRKLLQEWANAYAASSGDLDNVLTLERLRDLWEIR